MAKNVPTEITTSIFAFVVANQRALGSKANFPKISKGQVARALRFLNRINFQEADLTEIEKEVLSAYRSAMALNNTWLESLNAAISSPEAWNYIKERVRSPRYWRDTARLAIEHKRYVRGQMVRLANEALQHAEGLRKKV